MIKYLLIFILTLNIFSSCSVFKQWRKDDGEKDKKQLVINSDKKEKTSIDEENSDIKTDVKENSTDVKENINIDTLNTEITYKNYIKYLELLKGKDISDNNIKEKVEKIVSLLNHTENFDRVIEFLDSFSDKDNLSDKTKEIYKKIIEVKSINSNKIGVIIPKIGKYRRWATDIENGLLLAKKRLGSNYKFIIVTTNGSASETRKAVEKLIFKEHVLMILGTIKNSNTEVVAKITNGYKIPFISLSKSYDLAKSKKYVFNYFAGEDDITDSLVKYSIQKLKLKRFGIFYPDSGYGNRNMIAFWNAVKKYGGKVTAVQLYPPNKDNSAYIAPAEKLVGKHYLSLRNDYNIKRRQITQNRSGYARKKALESLKKELLPIVDFDALFIPESASITTLLLPYLALYDINFKTGDAWQNKLAAMKAKDKHYALKFVQLLGISAWADTSILDGASKYAKGGIFPVAYDKNIKKKEIVTFRNRYIESYSKEPSFFSLLGYEIVEILNHIDKTTESNNNIREKVTDTLLTKNFMTLSGLVSFDADGNASIPLFLMKFSSGSYYNIK